MKKHPLTKWLETHNIERVKFAKKVGVESNHLGKIERGLRYPSAELTQRIFKLTKGEVDANMLYRLKVKVKETSGRLANAGG
jgi:transcriptional regulator with XRE-family HTH domain